MFLQVPPRRLPYGQTKDTFTVNTAGVGTAATASVNDVMAGWTAGGGIEGAFGGGWSAKNTSIWTSASWSRRLPYRLPR